MSNSFETIEGNYLQTNCSFQPYKDLQSATNLAVRLSFFENFQPDDTFSTHYSSAPGDISYNSYSQHPVTIFCINIGKELFIYAEDNHNIPIDRRIFKSTPTCHAFRQASTDASLLVGLSSGEVQLIYPTRKEVCKTFNDDRVIEKTSVTYISWVPNSPNQFVVSHLNGSFYLYDEKLVAFISIPTYDTFKETPGFSVYTCRTKTTRNPLYRWVFGNRVASGSTNSLLSIDLPLTECNAHSLPTDNGVAHDNNSTGTALSDLVGTTFMCLPAGAGEDTAINQFSFSPCGLYLAVVSQDGYLRVVVYHAMDLYGYMRSYFAGLLCVDWSPDSCYIVVGGQDDLVTVWSMAERAVICRCEGHRSWVSAVRFDPYLCPNSPELTTSKSRLNCEKGAKMLSANTDGNLSYRIGSVGQDTMFCLWDLSEDIIRQGIAFAQDAHPPCLLDSTISRNSPLAKSPLTSPSTSRFPTFGKNSLRFPRANFSKSRGRSKTIPGPSSSVRSLFGFFTVNRRKSNRLHQLSVDTDHSSMNHGTQTLNRSDMPTNCYTIDSNRLPNGESTSNDLRVYADINDHCLLGSPVCPRFEDVPLLEPLVCTVLHQNRLTDLLFRPDTVHVVCQHGMVRCWTRPQRNKKCEFIEETSTESDTCSRKSSLDPNTTSRLGSPVAGCSVQSPPRMLNSRSQPNSTGRSHAETALPNPTSSEHTRPPASPQVAQSPSNVRSPSRSSNATTEGQSRLCNGLGSPDVNCSDV